MRYIIHEYQHDSISTVELAYIVSEGQPLMGGSTDSEESSRVIRPVHRVADLAEARAWIMERIPKVMATMTAADYHVSEVPHSQGVLCVEAVADSPTDDDEEDA